MPFPTFLKLHYNLARDSPETVSVSSVHLSHRVGMYGDFLDLGDFLRPPLLVDLQSLQLIQRIQPIDDLITRKTPHQSYYSNTTHGYLQGHTLPKTVFSPSRCGWLPYVIKNWLWFVPGPELAMLTTPLALCLSAGRISSSNFSPHMLLPPFPLPSSPSPVCTMNVLMLRWKGQSLK